MNAWPRDLAAPADAGAAGQVTRIRIRDLEVQACLGVYAHECHTPQRVRIAIELQVAIGIRPERLEHVVDYASLAERVRALVRAGHTPLVETLAERIASLCLEDARVLHATVGVEKPDAAADIAAVGVEIERWQAR